MTAPSAVKREVRAFRELDDAFPRLVVGLDPLPPALPDGVLYQDARDFLAAVPLPGPAQ